MKKIKDKGPMMLVDKVFSIPLFSAKQQQYKCTEVADLGTDANSKKYGVYFKWIASSYSVPEIIRLDITLRPQQTKQIEVQLFEKNSGGNYIPLYHRSYDMERISSVKNIQTMINDLIAD